MVQNLFPLIIQKKRAIHNSYKPNIINHSSAIMVKTQIKIKNEFNAPR